MSIQDTDIAFAFFQRLKGSTNVTDLVGERIRPDTLKQKETLPAVRYELISSESWQHLGGASGEARSRIQIDSYADTRLMANELAAAVKNLFDGFRGVIASIEVFDCYMDNKYDRVDPPPHGGDTFRKRRTLDFIVTHTEPTPTLL